MCLLLKSCFAGGVKRQSQHLPCCANVWYPLLLEILWRFLRALSVSFPMRTLSAMRYLIKQCRAVELSLLSKATISIFQSCREQKAVSVASVPTAVQRDHLSCLEMLCFYTHCAGLPAIAPQAEHWYHTLGSGNVWPEPYIDLVWMEKGRSHRLSQRKTMLSDTLIGQNGKKLQDAGKHVVGCPLQEMYEGHGSLTWLGFFILISHRSWQPFLIPQSPGIFLTTCFVF